MSAYVESLRRALASGNAADPEFRLSIYQASERALEKMLSERAIPQEDAMARRHALADAISQMEEEFGGLETDDAELPPAGIAADDHDIDFPERAEQPPHDDFPDSFETAEEPQRRGLVSKSGFVIILALLFAAILLYIVSTVFQGVSEPVETPVTTGDSTETGGETQQLAWISVFSGANIDRLATPGGGRVEAVSTNGRDAVRMQSPEGHDSEVLLSVGPGLVSEIAGAKVRVEVTAGSPDSRLREFSIRCLFGSESVCDRQRFVTNMQEEAFVFDVAVPANAASPASLAITPGIGGEGPDIDLFAVRMRVIGQT